MHTLYSEAARLRESMAGERSQIELFLQRASSFAAGLPDLQARIDAVSSRFESIDDSSRKAEALTSLVGQLEGADDAPERTAPDPRAARGMPRLAQRAEAETDRRFEEQHARRGGSRRDPQPASKASRTRRPKRSRSWRTSARRRHAWRRPPNRSPGCCRTSGARRNGSARSEVADDDVTAQEGRLIDILARSETAANTASARVAQMQSLAEELERSAAGQGQPALRSWRASRRKQLEVAMQAREARRPAPGARREHQGAGPAPATRAAADKRLGAFQTRLDELQSATSEVERRMEQLAERETVITRCGSRSMRFTKSARRAAPIQKRRDPPQRRDGAPRARRRSCSARSPKPRRGSRHIQGRRHGGWTRSRSRPA